MFPVGNKRFYENCLVHHQEYAIVHSDAYTILLPFVLDNHIMFGYVKFGWGDILWHLLIYQLPLVSLAQTD